MNCFHVIVIQRGMMSLSDCPASPSWRCFCLRAGCTSHCTLLQMRIGYHLEMSVQIVAQTRLKTKTPRKGKLYTGLVTEMPFLGWIEMTFQLASVIVQAEELLVSVTGIKGQRLFHPMVGYKIIEDILKTPQKIQAGSIQRSCQRRASRCICTTSKERAGFKTEYQSQ